MRSLPCAVSSIEYVGIRKGKPGTAVTTAASRDSPAGSSGNNYRGPHKTSARYRDTLGKKNGRPTSAVSLSGLSYHSGESAPAMTVRAPLPPARPYHPPLSTGTAAVCTTRCRGVLTVSERERESVLTTRVFIRPSSVLQHLRRRRLSRAYYIVGHAAGTYGNVFPCIALFTWCL